MHVSVLEATWLIHIYVDWIRIADSRQDAVVGLRGGAGCCCVNFPKIGQRRNGSAVVRPEKIKLTANFISDQMCVLFF